jgi:AcrR family transcriptional regulator
MKTPTEQGDLRVRRTHKLLWEALMAEMAKRPFEEITVTDLCERAMVHRTTFYKHHEDKYALLERGMRQMYDALVAEVAHLPPSAYSLAHPPPYFVRLFEHVAEHQPFYRLMLCGEGVGRFQKLVRAYVADQVEARMRALPPADQHFAVPIAMRVQFFAGAILSLLAWWLENDLPYSPHLMAQYLLSVHDGLSPHA